MNYILPTLKSRFTSLSFLLLFGINLLCSEAQAQCSEGFVQTFLILNFGSVNTYYNLQSTSPDYTFQGANIGNFCPSSTFILEGGQNQIYTCGGANIWQNQVWYRVYSTSASPGSFIPITQYYQTGYSNGCGGVNQTWEASGANINLLSGLSAGTYYLEVYSTANYNYCGDGTIYASNSGSNYRATFTVYATPSPTVNNPTICSGQTATLTATGGTSYQWNTGATTNSITATTTGTYPVTVTNSSGCTASASGNVTVNPLPTPTVTNDTVCSGVTATLTATGGVSYVWSTTATTASITTTTAGTYSVTATNAAGCSATASGNVVMNSLPTPSVNNDTVCSGVTATLTASGGGELCMEYRRSSRYNQYNN